MVILGDNEQMVLSKTEYLDYLQIRLDDVKPKTVLGVTLWPPPGLPGEDYYRAEIERVRRRGELEYYLRFDGRATHLRRCSVCGKSVPLLEQYCAECDDRIREEISVASLAS